MLELGHATKLLTLRPLCWFHRRRFLPGIYPVSIWNGMTRHLYCVRSNIFLKRIKIHERAPRHARVWPELPILKLYQYFLLTWRNFSLFCLSYSLSISMPLLVTAHGLGFCSERDASRGLLIFVSWFLLIFSSKSYIKSNKYLRYSYAYITPRQDPNSYDNC